MYTYEEINDRNRNTDEMWTSVSNRIHTLTIRLSLYYWGSLVTLCSFPNLYVVVGIIALYYLWAKPVEKEKFSLQMYFSLLTFDKFFENEQEFLDYLEWK